jgi:DNA-binding YbaB/EbfC family protein
MVNMMKLVRQAAAMQKDLARVQEGLAQQTVEFSSGGGMVSVTATADGAVRRIRIDPRLVNPADVEMLEDAVTAAVNGALKQGRDRAAAEMQKLTAGLGLPGGLGLTP